MPNRQLLLLSNSKLYGEDMFAWCSDTLKYFLTKNNVTKLLFVPYANRDYESYANKVSAALNKLGFQVESIHHKPDPIKAVEDCQGILVGGGNTFLLLKTLYDKKLLEPIRTIVFEKGIPYMGASAGSNVATRSINTTNDMPIIYPPSFEALKLVPFNINPHYIDPEPHSHHMGETREDRIREYLQEPDSAPVLGLREGIGLLVENDKAVLKGRTSAKLFEKDELAKEYMPEDDLSFLLDIC